MTQEYNAIDRAIERVAWDTAYGLIYNATSAEADIPGSIHVYTVVEVTVYRLIGSVLEDAVNREISND